MSTPIPASPQGTSLTPVRPRPVRSTLALAISSALLAGVATAADEAKLELGTVKVEEELTPDTNPYAVPGAPYLAKQSADPRRTRPLAETPATITVLTAQEIQDSGRSDLREILDGQPGITLGTGENGNAFGDRYVIRGHEARSDMFVDGLRDPGMTIRESFAVEQIEITKGPSSTFAGRGATGGAVNSASKRASTEYDFAKVAVGGGTDNYYRLTADGNFVVNYDTAIRINALAAAEDVPDRDPADRTRQGVALSGVMQPTDALEIGVDWYHLDADDTPDLGTYIKNLGGGVYGDPVSDIPVYTQAGDFLESTVDSYTLRLGYELSPSTRLLNLTRYGTTENGYVMTGAREGTTAGTLRLSTHHGWQEVESFANQLNLLTKLDFAGFNHELIFSAEYTDYSVLNGIFDFTGTTSANNVTTDAIQGAVSRDFSRGRWDSDWNIQTWSLAAMDTVDLTDRWTVFGGVRVDSFDFDMRTQNNALVETLYQYSDDLFNGHAGVSFQFLPEANVYATWSTASNINGGESDVGSSCGYGGVCTTAGAELGTPENTESLELGTKWELMGGKLLATAAVFQITKDDVMEQGVGGSYATLGTLNTGKNEVEGIEFGIAGNLTDKLSVQAGVALMNAKVLKSVTAANEGKTLANFADKTASLHLKYQATPKFAFGGTMTYEGERYTGQADSAANEAMKVPDYTTYDLFGTYNIDRDLRARVNIANATDEDYYLAAYRSGSFTYKGDGRSVHFTVEYDF